MCLLLNYPLANLHVATERAMDECGNMINHHFSQSRGSCQENKKKKILSHCYQCEDLKTEKHLPQNVFGFPWENLEKFGSYPYQAFS